MPIQFVAGDLFENAYSAQAFAHGCNCQGSMGAGIAKGFKAHYPEMFEQFRARCKAKPRLFNLGDAWLWKASDRPWVFNLGTQEAIWHARASYEAIETALIEMRRQADAEGIPSIALPRIGVGYGGLSWKKVRAIVERVFAEWTGQLIVYEDFVPATGAAAVVDTSDGPKKNPRPKTNSPKRAVKKLPRLKVRFRAITIYCTSVERSVRFYEGVLGAARKPTDNGIGDWFRLGGLDLSLVPNAAERTPATFPEHAMPVLWLEVEDLATATEHFKQEEVTLLDEGDGQFLMIADPDGLAIEVWEKEPTE